MSSHGLHNLAVLLLNGKQPPWGLIYKLFDNELETLCYYLEVKLRATGSDYQSIPLGLRSFLHLKTMALCSYVWICMVLT
jgi:hypothetical protein